MQLRLRRCRTTDTSRHGLRRGIVSAVLVAVVGGATLAIAPGTAQADGNVGAFLAHLNGLRASKGLPALALNGELSSVAQTHSQQMAAQGTIFHNSSLKTQVSNWQTLGENVGMGPSVSAIDNAFDNSPGHYANEVNTSYTQVGIGSVTNANGQIFVTLDFRRPMNASTPAPPAPKKTTTPKAPATTTPKVNGSSLVQNTTVAAQNAAAAAAAQAAAAQAAAAQNAARVAARIAADQLSASISGPLRTNNDPLARALVFSAHVNTIGQTG